MTRHIRRRTVWTLAGALIFSGVVTMAQNVLTQLGVTEADARQHVLDNIGNGGGAWSAAVDAARSGFAKVPAAGRPAATTALYAWAKAYVNSAAFKAAYAKKRTDEKPTYEAPTTTPDQEMQAKIDGDIADMQTNLQQMKGILPPADLAKVEAEMKTTIANMRGKTYMDAIRNEIVEKRTHDKKAFDDAMAVWTKQYPADPNVRIGEILREFLANTTDVDFAAKMKKVMGEGGEVMVYVNDAYNKKPWQWKVAFDYGPEVLAAARAAASAWVKELGPGR